MLCANCKKEADEVQDAEGVTYTRCKTCGWLLYNEAGEAIPCEPRDDVLKPLEGGQTVTASAVREEVGPDSKSHPAEKAEPAPDIEQKPKLKAKPKPEPQNEPSPTLEVHFDDN